MGVDVEADAGGGKREGELKGRASKPVVKICPVNKSFHVKCKCPKGTRYGAVSAAYRMCKTLKPPPCRKGAFRRGTYCACPKGTRLARAKHHLFVYCKPVAKPVAHPGFVKYPGDCVGHDIRVLRAPLAKCMAICLRIRQCAGISYRARDQRCVPKHRSCPRNRIRRNDHIFYLRR